MLYACHVPVKLAYFVSHPIQYQAPLLRRIAQEPDIDLTVFYSTDHSVQGYADEGFGGVRVRWDIPLLGGYKHEFLPGIRKTGASGASAPISYGIFSRLRRGKFDAVWVHGYHTLDTLHALTAAKLLGIPALVRAEPTLDDRPRGRGKRALRWVFFSVLRRMTNGVLTIGSKNAEYWRAMIGARAALFPMPYAVDNDYFQQRAAQAASGREDLRRELNLRPGLPVFLYASKLQRRKRCTDLVEAFLRLAPAPGQAPAAYLLIAGDGEDRAVIEQRIADSGTTHVCMLGFQNQSELPRLFDLCDAFVLPSVYEPWGVIVNEAMNASRAVVVASQVGCAPDLVRDGENGFLFPGGDVDALNAVLRRFVDNPSLAREMGQQALRTISAHSFEQDVQGLRQALAAIVPGFRA